jgi:hypothetical protein
MVVKLQENEVVVRVGTSDHLVGEKKVPGKLIVTNQRVYFYSMEDASQIVKLEILPKEISEVIFYKTKLFISNGLNVMMKDGKNYNFLLKKRDELGMLINKMY